MSGKSSRDFPCCIIKRTSVSSYRAQRRGGKGVTGAVTKDEDFTEHLFVAQAHNYLLIFTDQGKVYWKKVYEIPEGTKTSKGRAVQNLINIEPGVDLSDLLRSGALPEYESALILERYGVEFAKRRRCATPGDAAAAAAELGGRLVVKADGPAHKQAVGGVVVGVRGEREAADAALQIGGPVLVAEQIAAGFEVFCGMSRDPAWGPVLAVGLGGRAIEALSLAALDAMPLDEVAAAALVTRAPGLASLASEATQSVLARTLVALARLAEDYPEVEEIDVNPLILSSDRAIAVDALVVVR